MNPWKIIGWIVLAFIGLMMYSCIRVASNMDSGTTGSSAASPAASRLDHRVELMSFVCEKRYERTRAELTIRNEGSTTMEFSKAIVNFDGAMVDGYFSPHTLAPGVIATNTIYSPGGGGCQLIAVQDRDGVQAAIRDTTKP